MNFNRFQISIALLVSSFSGGLLALFYFLPWATICDARLNGVKLTFGSGGVAGLSAYLWLLLLLPVVFVPMMALLWQIIQPGDYQDIRLSITLGAGLLALVILALTEVILIIQSVQVVDIACTYRIGWGYLGAVLTTGVIILSCVVEQIGARRYLAQKPVLDYNPTATMVVTDADENPFMPAVPAVLPAPPVGPTAPPAVPPPPVRPVAPAIDPASLTEPYRQDEEGVASAESTMLMEERMPSLIIREGPLVGRTYVVTHDNFLLGRQRYCDLQLPDKYASREHARLRYAQGQWFIQDQDSLGGIFVNGERVKAIRLKDGDQIKIGNTVMVFRFG